MRGSQTFFCKWFISGIVITMFTIITLSKEFLYVVLKFDGQSRKSTSNPTHVQLVVWPFIIHGLKTFQSNSQWPITIENFHCRLLPNQDHISMYKYSDVATWCWFSCGLKTFQSTSQLPIINRKLPSPPPFNPRPPIYV